MLYKPMSAEQELELRRVFMFRYRHARTRDNPEEFERLDSLDQEIQRLYTRSERLKNQLAHPDIVFNYVDD